MKTAHSLYVLYETLPTDTQQAFLQELLQKQQERCKDWRVFGQNSTRRQLPGKSLGALWPSRQCLGVDLFGLYRGVWWQWKHMNK